MGRHQHHDDGQHQGGRHLALPVDQDVRDQQTDGRDQNDCRLRQRRPAESGDHALSRATRARSRRDAGEWGGVRSLQAQRLSVADDSSATVRCCGVLLIGNASTRGTPAKTNQLCPSAPGLKQTVLGLCDATISGAGTEPTLA